jgi:hypothetical protein
MTERATPRDAATEGGRPASLLHVDHVDPVLSEAGRRGARSRWGPPRHARLDDLTSEQRRLVLALLDAARSETKMAGPDRDSGPAVSQEGSNDARQTTP